MEEGVDDREEEAIEAVAASFRPLGSFFFAAGAFFPFFAFGKGFVGTSGELTLAVEGPGVDRSEGAALSG